MNEGKKNLSAVRITISLSITDRIPIADGRPTTTPRPAGAAPIVIVDPPPIPVDVSAVPIVTTTPVITGLPPAAFSVVAGDVRIDVSSSSGTGRRPSRRWPIPVSTSVSVKVLVHRIPPVTVVDGWRGPWRKALLSMPGWPPLIRQRRRPIARVAATISTVPAPVTVCISEAGVGPRSAFQRS